MIIVPFRLIQLKEWQLRAIKAAISGEDVRHGYSTNKVWKKPLLPFSGRLFSSNSHSLMCDQTAALQSKNHFLLGTAQNNKSIQERVCVGEFELVFVSPESFFTDSGIPHLLFTQLSLRQQQCLIAVDEAHLLSSWKTYTV